MFRSFAIAIVIGLLVGGIVGAIAAVPFTNSTGHVIGGITCGLTAAFLFNPKKGENKKA